MTTCTRCKFLSNSSDNSDMKLPNHKLKVLVLCDSNLSMERKTRDKVKQSLDQIDLLNTNINDIKHILETNNISSQDISRVEGFLELVSDTKRNHTIPHTWNHIQIVLNALGISIDIEYYLIDPSYIIDVPQINMYSAYFGVGKDKLPANIRDVQFDIIFDSFCMNMLCRGYPNLNFITPVGLSQIRDTLTTSNGFGMYIRYTKDLMSTGDMKYCISNDNQKGRRLSEMSPKDIQKEFPVGLLAGVIKSKTTSQALYALYKVPIGNNLVIK